jgi:hypothetical protein
MAKINTQIPGYRQNGIKTDRSNIFHSCLNMQLSDHPKAAFLICMHKQTSRIVIEATDRKMV